MSAAWFDSGRWNNYWSSSNPTHRYRQQIRALRKEEGKGYIVRTEVTELETWTIQYGASYTVPPEHVVEMRRLVSQWTNLDTDDKPLFPPGMPDVYADFSRFEGAHSGPQ